MKPFRKYLFSLSVFLNLFVSDLFAQAPPNFNFEQSAPGIYTNSTSIVGWTLHSSLNNYLLGGIACIPNPPIIWNQGASECSIVATPVWNVPWIGFLPPSPLGGNKVVRLQDTQVSNGPMNRLSTQFQVNSQSDLLRFCFAGSWQGLNSCCDAAVLRIDFYNCTNSLTLLPQLSLTVGACPGPVSCSLTGATYWTNWQTFTRDLSPYIGQCIKMVVTVADEVYSGRSGSAFFDASLGSQMLQSSPGLGYTGSGGPVSYCSGSTSITIQGPLGYNSYQWYAPSVGAIPSPVGNLSTLNFTNALSGNVFTLVATGTNSLSQIFTYTAVISSVNISGLGSTASCSLGTTGSATIVANGSSLGYNYLWQNNFFQTVSTSSVASNLSPGSYTVSLSAPGSSLCGISSTVITIPVTSLTTKTVIKPVCQLITTLCAAGSGSNYTWYTGNSPIGGPTGSSTCIFVSNPGPSTMYQVVHQNSNGCKDSTQFYFVTPNPASVQVLSTSTLCPGSNSGTASIQLNPAYANLVAPYSFTISSLNNTLSPYNFTTQLNTLNVFTITGLSASTNYSIQARDAECIYQYSFSIQTESLGLNSAFNSHTLCQNTCVQQSIQLLNPLPGISYTFSWSPNTWVSSPNSTLSFICPSLVPSGTSSTTQYTFFAQNPNSSCVFSRTFDVTGVNPQLPVISPLPVHCQYSSIYNFTVQPLNSTLYSLQFPSGTSQMQIDPTFFSPGHHTLLLSNGLGNCQASAQFSFTIGGPSISISGPTQICIGNSVSLSAFGANTYTWSTGAYSNSIQVSPNSTATYTVLANHNLDNCISSHTISVAVLFPPNLQVSTNQQICSGSTATLVAGGASSYSWSNGQNLSMIIVSPNSSTIFSVVASGTSNTCLAQAQVYVQVNPKPTLFVSGNSFMCLGDENLFTVAGADTYSWSTGALTNSIVISPLQNFTLTVVGTYTDSGCSSTLLIGVDVEECVNLPEIKNEISLKLFPNPSTGIFTLESEKQFDFVILNAQGSILFSGKTEAGPTELDLRAFPQGLYFVECRSGKEWWVEKLIKN